MFHVGVFRSSIKIVDKYPKNECTFYFTSQLSFSWSEPDVRYLNPTLSQRPRSCLEVTMPENLPPFSMTSTPPTHEKPQGSDAFFRVSVGQSFLGSRSQPRRSPRRNRSCCMKSLTSRPETELSIKP